MDLHLSVALLFPSAHLWESPTTQELSEGQNPGSSNSREQKNFTCQKDRIWPGPAVKAWSPEVYSLGLLQRFPPSKKRGTEGLGE